MLASMSFGNLIRLLAITGLLVAAGTPTTAANTAAARSGVDSVRLSDVQTLTLYTGQSTAGRRSAPVAQIECVGGTAKGRYNPPTIQCKNMGTDGTDIQWECKADLDNAYRFGETTVTCEGYSFPDDPFVLAGSCGVEYTLELTQEGREQERNHAFSGSSRTTNHRNADSSVWSTVLSMAILGCLLFGICSCINGGGHHQPIHPGGPPPSYSSSCNGGYGAPRSSDFTPPRTYGASSGSGPGFWTGAATGAMFGSALNRAPAYHTRPAFSSRRGWGGDGGAWSGGSSTTRGSSGTRTASGFGGTRRR